MLFYILMRYWMVPVEAMPKNSNSTLETYNKYGDTERPQYMVKDHGRKSTVSKVLFI